MKFIIYIQTYISAEKIIFRYIKVTIKNNDGNSVQRAVFWVTPEKRGKGSENELKLNLSTMQSTGVDYQYRPHMVTTYIRYNYVIKLILLSKSLIEIFDLVVLQLNSNYIYSM